MLSALLPGFACGLLIATFPSNAPPPAARRPYELLNKNDNSSKIFAAPTTRFSTIAVCDNNVFHYFLHRKNVLFRCIWDRERALSIYDKAFIIAEVRARYSHMANVALLISPTTDSIQQGDVDAWTMANRISDDPVF
jgi:hypothetical protein